MLFYLNVTSGVNIWKKLIVHITSFMSEYYKQTLQYLLLVILNKVFFILRWPLLII